MNCDTGIITTFGTKEELSRAQKIAHGKLVEVDMRLATEKQKREMRVSLSDHKSPLGRSLTVTRNQLKRQRRKLRGK